MKTKGGADLSTWQKNPWAKFDYIDDSDEVTTLGRSHLSILRVSVSNS